MMNFQASHLLKKKTLVRETSMVMLKKKKLVEKMENKRAMVRRGFRWEID